MPQLADVFAVINDLKHDGVVEEYAVGGAMALLFYIEPAATYDLDIFALLPPGQGLLVDLRPVYAALGRRGFSPDREHIRIYDVPVQILPAYNALVEEAVETARSVVLDGVDVRVVDPEHLAAIALQTGGDVRRLRALQLVSSGAADLTSLNALLQRFGLPALRLEG